LYNRTVAQTLVEAVVPETWPVDEATRPIDFLGLAPAGRDEVRMPEAGVWRSPTVPGLALDLARFRAGVDRAFARLPG
jgi:hypothetical protein